MILITSPLHHLLYCCIHYHLCTWCWFASGFFQNVPAHPLLARLFCLFSIVVSERDLYVILFLDTIFVNAYTVFIAYTSSTRIVQQSSSFFIKPLSYSSTVIVNQHKIMVDKLSKSHKVTIWISIPYTNNWKISASLAYHD